MIKTDKGAQYVGGIIKLSQDELSRSEGDKITLPVIKCLDKAATVEIAVDQVQSIPGLKGKKSTTV